MFLFPDAQGSKNLPEDNWSHLNLFLQDSPHGLADHSNGRGVDRWAALGKSFGILPSLERSGKQHISMRRWLCRLSLKFVILYVSHTMQFKHDFFLVYQKTSMVQKVNWWMAHYKSKTPKRHLAFGNTKVLLALDRGRLRKWKRAGVSKVQTAVHYLDKQGKKRYKGTAQLKGTENLVWI